jgi:transposase
MPTSKIGKFFYNAFGIKGVTLKSFNVIENVFVFACELHAALKKCSKCHSKNVHKKDTKTRKLKLVPVGRRKCILEIVVHKFKCKDCGCSAWVDLPFAVGKLPMTRPFVNYILSLVRLGTIKAIAMFLDLEWKTVKNIHKDYLKEKHKKISYKNLAYLSIDEFSIRKGHKYMTVFLDISTGKIIYAVVGRAVEDIESFLKKLAKRARKLKAIAMDLSPSYISAVRKYLPDVPIVFDRFHVMKILNQALDELRKKEREKYRAEGLDIAKGDRFLFFRNYEDLSMSEQDKLKQLFEINVTLAKAHAMKEQFRGFWEKSSMEEGAKFLVHWIHTAVSSRISALAKVGFSFLRHYEGLLSYFDHHISNGMLEGINNKIKVQKRMAYGYRDNDYFILLLFELHEKSVCVA